MEINHHNDHISGDIYPIQYSHLFSFGTSLQSLLVARSEKRETTANTTTQFGVYVLAKIFSHHTIVHILHFDSPFVPYDKEATPLPSLGHLITLCCFHPFPDIALGHLLICSFHHRGCYVIWQGCKGKKAGHDNWLLLLIAVGISSCPKCFCYLITSFCLFCFSECNA